MPVPPPFLKIWSFYGLNFPRLSAGKGQEGVRIAQRQKVSAPQRQTASLQNGSTVYFTTLPPLLLWIQLHLEELLFLTYPSSLTRGCKQRLWLMHFRDLAACLQEAYSAGTFWDAPPLSHLSMSRAPFALPSMQLFTSDVWVVLAGISEFVDCFYFLFFWNVNCGRDLR